MAKAQPVIIFNGHLNEYEVWKASEVIAHGTDLDALLVKYPEAELREK